MNAAAIQQQRHVTNGFGPVPAAITFPGVAAIWPRLQIQERIARRLEIKLLKPSLDIHKFVVCEGNETVDGLGSVVDHKDGPWWSNLL